MKKLLLLFTMLLPVLAFSQDCSGKIKAAQASKTAGNYRLALAQFTAAASSCGESRRAEIEKEILDIYDRIEKLKDEALVARNLAKTEADKAKASEKIAADALSGVQKANLKAQAVLDSLNIVLDNLGKANADKVRLILAEVARNQQELNFDAAVDKIKTAKILRALPDSVNMAYQNLSRLLLTHAHKDIRAKAYKPASQKIKSAGELNVQPDSVQMAERELHRFLFENIDLDIKNSDYDTALTKINILKKFQVPSDTIEYLLFEIAFCYTETDRPDQAVALLDSMAQLRRDDALSALLRQYSGKEPAQKTQWLRQALQQIEPVNMATIVARYFPKDFAAIPDGVFIAGSTTTAENVASSANCPINVHSFALAAHETTFYEYDLFCVATKRQKPSDNGWGRGSRPVVNVNWLDVVEYCNWRSRREGLTAFYTITTDTDEVTCNWSANGYRLPKETEWEFAAGNGTVHTRFAWGNDFPTTRSGGNVADETVKSKFPDWQVFAGYSDGFTYTAPVGSYPCNNFGLYDMTGNVWEWCWDTYDENYCRSGHGKDDSSGSSLKSERMLRGGSWGSFPKDCNVNNRFHNNPNTRNFSTGFRLAKN
jgi:formylglycine-generating enzyme required for sulfatase activity